ncbi:hypothetical protein GCM10022271_21660 [Corallibacter vietnamensis]|uniref:Uncharacterized protein n=1 Tax=Corallibacter vietnamensis TaxID=904130 RepID=A0ABP7HCA4_9FLAO
MAKNNSFIKLDGTLDGLTFYRQNGESFVKTQSKISKNRIMKDPSFKRTRENMIEFAGASKAGKAFRDGFASMVKLMGDAYISARLSGVMKLINSVGVGKRGERDIDIVLHHAMLRGFEFNKKLPLKSIFYAPYPMPEIDESRRVVTWTVTDFDTDAFVNAPENATHFKLVLATSYVSNYLFNKNTGAFDPENELVNGTGGQGYSDAIPLGGMVGSDIRLEVDMSAIASVPATTALFAGVGILFYQEINGEFYEFAQGNTMKVAVSG